MAKVYEVTFRNGSEIKGKRFFSNLKKAFFKAEQTVAAAAAVGHTLELHSYPSVVRLVRERGVYFTSEIGKEPHSGYSLSVQVHTVE